MKKLFKKALKGIKFNFEIPAYTLIHVSVCNSCLIMVDPTTNSNHITCSLPLFFDCFQAELISAGPTWFFFPSERSQMHQTRRKTDSGSGLQSVCGEKGELTV